MERKTCSVGLDSPTHLLIGKKRMQNLAGAPPRTPFLFVNVNVSWRNIEEFRPLIIRMHRFKGPPLFQKQIGPPKFRALTPQIEKAAPGIPLFTKSHTATQTPSRNRRKATDFNKHRDAQSSPRPMQSH